jgi:hypothetical protein
MMMSLVKKKKKKILFENRVDATHTITVPVEVEVDFVDDDVIGEKKKKKYLKMVRMQHILLPFFLLKLTLFMFM